MRADGDDAGRSRSSSAPAVLRTAGLTGGFLLAVAATAIVLLTEDPQLLRVAVVAAAWAFVLAALSAVRRRGPGTGAAGEPRGAGRESAGREPVEREPAARPEPVHPAVDDPHRQAAESIRAELAELRRDLAGVAELREAPAEVVALRRELGELRAGLAQVAHLQDHVAQLAGLRGDLAELAGLRADIGRLRAEPADQLSGEMLVERVLLRTQSTRTGPATTESPALHPVDRGWLSSSGTGPTAARPAVQGEELPGTRTSAAPAPLPPLAAPPRPAAVPPVPRPPSVRAVAPPPPPLEWLAERALVDPDVLPRTRHAAAAPPARPAVPPSDELRRRRTDDHLPDGGRTPEALSTVQRPVVRREGSPVPAAGPAPSPEPPVAPRPEEGPPPHPQGGSSSRLAELLAENGIQLSSGSRRRHRYREDDEPDDVLARVLGRS